jgi:hypothetical protein
VAANTAKAEALKAAIDRRFLPAALEFGCRGSIE